MLLSPRARRGNATGNSSNSDVETGSPKGHDRTSTRRQRSQAASTSGSTASRHGPQAFFPATAAPASSCLRIVCAASIVPVLATACLCTLLFCVLHLYLTDQLGSEAVRAMHRRLSTLHSATPSHAAARQQHILATVESCLRQHPSYAYDANAPNPPAPHTRRARPFQPLPADCLANLSLSTHEHALLQLAQLVRRMHASDGELDFFDLLANRLIDDVGPAIPYTPLPSAWLQWAAWDDGLDSGEGSGQAGGDCELLQLGERQYAHKQSVYAVRDATAQVHADDRHHTIITTTSQQANTDAKLCKPTSGQLGQEQDTITVQTAASLQPGNASYLPRPPVTYLLSRHNSANPWHTLIEHIYPQWIQMFLRGDFPYPFQQLTTTFTPPTPPAPPLPPTPTPTPHQPHFDLFVYHETGGPNGPQFDGWWQALLGAPVRYVRPGDSVGCEVCIFGPPKALAVYDYWGGSRLVYDSATQFVVRLFRRHVYARVDVAPWRVRADGAPAVTYSFQRRASGYWRPRGEDGRQQKGRVEYVLPDFPRLLEAERAAESERQGKNVSMAELAPSGFDFAPLADPSRSILIAGNGSWDGWPTHDPHRLTALSSLPLVVLTRRHPTHERTLRPFPTFLSFYQQPSVAARLPYHLLLVYVEDLPLVDQVALLAGAAVLLSVEGASEINQLWLPLGSVVVEVECDRRFYDGNRPRPWHQSLGQYLGHLFVQWSVEGCDQWDEAKGLRLHELLVRVLESKERNRYVYMS